MIVRVAIMILGRLSVFVLAPSSITFFALYEIFTILDQHFSGCTTRDTVDRARFRWVGPSRIVFPNAAAGFALHVGHCILVRTFPLDTLMKALTVTVTACFHNARAIDRGWVTRYIEGTHALAKYAAF